VAAGERAIAAVRGGSNIIDYRTDQGLWSDPNGGWYAAHPDAARYKNVGGSNFFDYRYGGREWAARQRAAEAQFGGGYEGYQGIPQAFLGAGLSTVNNAPTWNNTTSSTVFNGPVNVMTNLSSPEDTASYLSTRLRNAAMGTFANNGAQ
jgi:hypothetical protein